MDVDSKWNIDDIGMILPLHDDVVRVISYHYRLRLATQYIVEHAAAPVTLRTVARVVNMHPGAFSRFFTLKTGMTFHEFIRMVRITMAEQRLLNEDCSIAALSVAFGFGSVSAFVRNFKLMKGYPPTLYRKRVLRTAATNAKQLRLVLERRDGL